MKLEHNKIFNILGHITVFFSTLDILTTMLIIDLTTEEYQANNTPLHDRMTLGQKFAFLKILQDEDVKDIDIMNRIRNLLDDGTSVSQERNRFMHNQWEFKEENLNKGIINCFQIKGLNNWEWNTNSKEYDITRLEKLLSDIGALQKKVGDELKRLQKKKRT